MWYRHTHYDARQFDNCRSLEWKQWKKDDHEGSEKRRFVLIQCTKRGNHLKLLASLLHNFSGMLSRSLFGWNSSGWTPTHSVNWPGIPYKRAMFFNRFYLTRLLVDITTPLGADSKNISRELSTMTLVQPVQIVKHVKPVCVARVAPKKTPLERELEAINGISLKQLGQAGTEVRGRVSVVTPTTASRSRFHPQLVDQSWPDKELVVVETYHGSW